jgi:hypothetical protein
MMDKIQFKAGDKVRITGKFKSYENGWDNLWQNEMDAAVGREGTVVCYSPQIKNVGVDIPGFSLWGYPDFGVELAPTKFKVGDKITISYLLNSYWAGFGTVNRLYDKSDRYLSVRMRTGLAKDKEGDFLKNKILLGEILSATLPPPTAKAVSVFKLAQSIALDLGKSVGFVNIEHVQKELENRGYAPADLGNAAGGVFRGPLWKDTGRAVLSGRKLSHRRKVTVWEYIKPKETASLTIPVTDAQKSLPHAAFLTSVPEEKTFKVGDRVQVTFDAKDGNVKLCGIWDGTGTVETVPNGRLRGAYTVRLDHRLQPGRFLARNLALLPLKSKTLEKLFENSQETLGKLFESAQDVPQDVPEPEVQGSPENIKEGVRIKLRRGFTSGDFLYRIGETGTVIRHIEGVVFPVRFKSDRTEQETCARYHEVVLLPESKAERTPATADNVKVGTKVRVSTGYPASAQGYLMTGDEGEVLDILSGAYPILVTFPTRLDRNGRAKIGAFRFSELELA